MPKSAPRAPTSEPAAAPKAPQRRAPARAKSEQRVKDILRVGRELFATKGYEHATTTEIARRLGISEATVFTYFRGKRELCVRVINDWYAEITAAIEQGLPREQSVRAQFRWFVHTHLELFLVEGTGLCAFVLSEGRVKSHGGHGELGDVLIELQRRYTAPLMELLAHGRTSGVLRDDVPLSLMRNLALGPIEHLLWEHVGTGKKVPVAETADSLVALIWPTLARQDHELVRLRALRELVQKALAST
ncbi:MAG: TetR/AcrR family transcriptional regulator [Paucibacter sp.]|nr:TetR/AcrR family transcriptional regulator [Roseateles sp.]